MHIGLHIPVILVRFKKKKLEFSRQIFRKKKNRISIFIKIRPVGAELLHEDGLTDMTKLIPYLLAQFTPSRNSRTMDGWMGTQFDTNWRDKTAVDWTDVLLDSEGMGHGASTRNCYKFFWRLEFPMRWTAVRTMLCGRLRKMWMKKVNQRRTIVLRKRAMMHNGPL